MYSISSLAASHSNLGGPHSSLHDSGGAGLLGEMMLEKSFQQLVRASNRDLGLELSPVHRNDYQSKSMALPQVLDMNWESGGEDSGDIKGYLGSELGAGSEGNQRGGDSSSDGGEEMAARMVGRALASLSPSKAAKKELKQGRGRERARTLPIRPRSESEDGGASSSSRGESGGRHKSRQRHHRHHHHHHHEKKEGDSSKRSSGDSHHSRHHHHHHHHHSSQSQSLNPVSAPLRSHSKSVRDGGGTSGAESDHHHHHHRHHHHSKSMRGGSESDSGHRHHHHHHHHHHSHRSLSRDGSPRGRKESTNIARKVKTLDKEREVGSGKKGHVSDGAVTRDTYKNTDFAYADYLDALSSGAPTQLETEGDGTNVRPLPLSRTKSSMHMSKRAIMMPVIESPRQVHRKRAFTLQPNSDAMARLTKLGLIPRVSDVHDEQASIGHDSSKDGYDGDDDVIVFTRDRYAAESRPSTALAVEEESLPPGVVDDSPSKMERIRRARRAIPSSASDGVVLNTRASTIMLVKEGKSVVHFPPLPGLRVGKDGTGRESSQSMVLLPSMSANGDGESSSTGAREERQVKSFPARDD
uniref:Uncharacterized protein n=1 Tax=Palpitomonas bilix TaxID=652834 RepID=A0A7S3G4L3_9EUKA|mmetsp:Transcript_28513/g.72687  ORF Transcript_28513/g.72687 Transcript_28513/m.72687 type:complete len:582 (+) Transcript_28513:311-2056(+)